MRTLFRMTVMMASLAAGAWALVEYGPPDTVQPIARRAIELADDLIGSPGTSADSAVLASPEITSLPAIFPSVEPSVSLPSTISPPPLVAQLSTQRSPAPGRLRMDGEPVALSPSIFANDAAHCTGDELLAATLDRLRALGATNVSATPWGRSGQLHRVSCDVPVGGQAGMTRHVEAVAANQAAAADDVLREIQSQSAPSYPVAKLE